MLNGVLVRILNERDFKTGDQYFAKVPTSRHKIIIVPIQIVYKIFLMLFIANDSSAGKKPTVQSIIDGERKNLRYFSSVYVRVGFYSEVQ